MPKLYQHQHEGTYYTRLYWPGVSAIVTRQIHPDGVLLLKRSGVRLKGEIPLHLIDELKERKRLATKEEMPYWGEVDWSPHRHLIGLPKPKPFPKENPFVTRQRQRERERCPTPIRLGDSRQRSGRQPNTPLRCTW